MPDSSKRDARGRILDALRRVRIRRRQNKKFVPGPVISKASWKKYAELVESKRVAKLVSRAGERWHQAVQMLQSGDPHAGMMIQLTAKLMLRSLRVAKEDGLEASKLLGLQEYLHRASMALIALFHGPAFNANPLSVDSVSPSEEPQPAGEPDAARAIGGSVSEEETEEAASLSSKRLAWAPPSELRRLPGIGDAIAGRIFGKQLAEVEEMKGIPAKVKEMLRSHYER